MHVDCWGESLTVLSTCNLQSPSLHHLIEVMSSLHDDTGTPKVPCAALAGWHGCHGGKGHVPFGWYYFAHGASGWPDLGAQPQLGMRDTPLVGRWLWATHLLLLVWRLR